MRSDIKFGVLRMSYGIAGTEFRYQDAKTCCGISSATLVVQSCL